MGPDVDSSHVVHTDESESMKINAIFYSRSSVLLAAIVFFQYIIFYTDVWCGDATQAQVHSTWPALDDLYHHVHRQHTT